MDPYYTPPQNSLQPPQTNPYEFILSPEKPPKKPFSPLGGSSFAMKLGLLLGGAVLLMIIIAVGASLLSGGGSGNSAATRLSLAQTQQELIRISAQGTTDARQQTTRDLAVTAQYTLISEQQKTLGLLTTGGKKPPKDKELNLKQDATVDQQFTSAKATSSFDRTFATVMQKKLTEYADTVKQMQATTKSQIEKDLLTNYYQDAQLLISQIPYTQKQIEAIEQQ